MSKLQVIHLLSDGKFHSGEELGKKLNMTRGGIWKVIQQLDEIGIEVHRVKGKGYQIPNGLNLLDKETITRQLPPTLLAHIYLEVMTEIHSTNQYLLDNKHHLPSGTIVLAEYQSCGRGRRQRRWLSPFGTQIAFSLLWNFDFDPSQCTGLSLATGVAVTHTLERCGLQQIQLKWPNDILWQNRKLSGVLIEISGESHSSAQVVIGIGINVALPAALCEEEWIDMTCILRKPLDRNQITAILIEEVIEMLFLFQRKGFNAFYKYWQALDAYYNAPILLSLPDRLVKGIAKGINRQGELILIGEDGKESKFLQGEASLRLDT